MKRLFWLGLGVATGVMVTRKAAEAAARFTPAGVGEQVGEGLRELASAIGSFGAEVRAGMVEREGELTQMVERSSGVPLSFTSADSRASAPARGRAPRPGARG